MSEQRHPQIVNADQVPATELVHGQRFYLRRKQLGSTAGAQKLGCTLIELPPGKRSWPLHYHAANEEAIYVLEGRGRVRIGDSETSVQAGDYVVLLAGPGSAHQTFNDSDAVLRYLCLSTMIGRVENWRAHGRWRVSIHALSIGWWVHSSTMATFPVPASSNGACRFPALRFPACFSPRVM
jgi:uncharacterized cupin superfamily protein